MDTTSKSEKGFFSLVLLVAVYGMGREEHSDLDS